MSAPVGSRVAPAVAFAGAARRYWLGVFPCARCELRHWRLRAGEILDPALRRHAVEAQRTKRDSLEGAMAFATFAPRCSRDAVVRALTAYQVAFDYIDTVSEQPNADPIANGRRLNQALLRALEPDGAHLDYYAHHNGREDAGYLWDLVDTCRTALSGLPSYTAIAELVRRATARVVSYQALNHGDAHGSLDAFTRWARAETRGSSGLRWWEIGAAAGSPLPVFALIAAAASPSTGAREAAALEGAYFPWIASLNSLLDNLIDRGEDAACGQRNLIDYYASPAETATRMQTLASQALRRTRALSDGQHHTMILAAMASFYHASPRACAPETRLVTQRILDTMVGDFAVPSTLILRGRHAVAGVTDRVGALRGALGAVIRHANSGIEAFADRRALAGSTRATGEGRDVSRFPALGERLPTPRRRAGKVGERASGCVLDSLSTGG